MKKRVAIYARVSTKDQSVGMQLNDLERYSRERRLNVFKVYEDSGISGTKETRPALNDLMDDARKRRFDVVLVWRFDRFARSTKHLVTALWRTPIYHVQAVSGMYRYAHLSHRTHTRLPLIW